jgi:acyl-CoA thioesterase
MPEGDPIMAPAHPQKVAEATRDAMYARDHAAQGLGITVTDIGPGRAVCTMTVRQDMVNGHAILHGGVCFTLADTCFAYACNSHNRVTVAQSASITFCAPGMLGDVLTATAEETWQQGRGGVTDVTVTNQDGAVLAMFRGNSRTIKGQVADLPNEESAQ